MTPKHDIVLSCKGLSHWIGTKKILHDVNLEVIRGEIVALVGETGCGKSTVLRAILGTHPTREGEVRVFASDGQSSQVRDQPGRDCGIVYQHYSLYPFLTVVQNVMLGLMFDQTTIPFRIFKPFRWRQLRLRHMDEAAALLTKLKLADAMHLYPHELSGGMRQRAAIAQALIMKPKILLLDEPFGALDESTREELQRMLLELYMENCQVKHRGEQPLYTILIVTHELSEAIYVGDRVVALSRYWNWKQLGYEACPGATVVYDEMAPVNFPDEERDFDVFARQRADIRASAFDPNTLRAREAFQHFWIDFTAGKGGGVFVPARPCESHACPLRTTCGFAEEVAKMARSDHPQITPKRRQDQLDHLLKQWMKPVERELVPLHADATPARGGNGDVSPGGTEAMRTAAMTECFRHPATEMLTYLAQHSPHTHSQMIGHLGPLLPILGDPPSPGE